MGEVYRAHDTRLGRDVALKILPDAMAANADHRARFEREARAVAALNHPHIVTIYSTEQDGDVRFLTMELVEGQTLDRLIAAGRDAAGAVLRHRHRAGGCAAGGAPEAHHAPRPEALERDGDRRWPRKVLDFGLASAAEALESDPARRHEAGTDAGGHDPRHRAVHVAGADRGEGRSITGATCSPSASCSTKWLSGRRPFTGDSSPALMSSILRDEPRPLRGAAARRCRTACRA